VCCRNAGAALVQNPKTIVFKIYYYTLFNISYTIRKFIYILYSPVVQAIQKVQNKGLRAVAGAYRATPIRELEKEVLVPPIDIYCSELCARHIRRTYSLSAGVLYKSNVR
jgi:hypothetical protein